MAAYHANVQSIWNLHVDCMADQMGKGIEQLDGLLRYQSGATCNRLWAKEYVHFFRYMTSFSSFFLFHISVSMHRPEH